MSSKEFGSITDVPGILVGHEQRIGDGWLTGVSVVLPPPGAIGGVDVRGGGPGTRETDALDPRTLVPTVDAVVLTGGSAFGLASADGVMRWCEEHRRGFPAADGVLVPIVPAAVIFDLGRGGDPAARPDAEMGYAAAANATDSTPRGSVGAGTGALIGGGAFKGGLGTASVPAAGAIVGALAVVNALGTPVMTPADGGTPGTPGSADPGPIGGHTPGGRLGATNTTLAVVATTARLDQAQAARLATVAHDGLARALDPVHTLVDGDTVFALSTGQVELAGLEQMVQLHAAAAKAVQLAVLDAVRSAGPVQTPAGSWPAFPLP